MKKAAAYLAMLLIAGALVGADLLLLTRSENVSRLVGEELKKVDGLSWKELKASISGVIELRGASFQLGDPARHPPQEAGRVEARLRSLSPVVVERVVFEEVRLRLSESLLDELSKREPSKRTIRDVLPDPDHLPRAVVTGGTLEAILPAVFEGGKPQVLEIRDVGATPVGGYRVRLEGRFASAVYGAWTAAGDVDLEGGPWSLALEAAGLRIGPAMKEPLASGPRWIYEKYRPGGLCDLRVRLAQSPGGELDFKATLAARDMQILYKYFPYPCDRLQGEIDFFAEGFRVKHMTGRHGSAVVQFDGKADGYATESAYAFRLDIVEMPLDGDLRAAIDEEGRRVWDQFRPQGRIRVRGQALREQGPDKPSRIPLDIELADGAFKFDGFPYEAKNVAGQIRFEGADARIRRLVARDGPTTIEIAGDIQDLTGDARVDLRVSARAVPLDARLKAALGEEARKTWDQFAPGGIADLDVEVKKEKGKEPVTAVRARARGNTVTYAKIPLPATDVEGVIEIGTDGTVLLHHVTGKTRGARLHLHGSIKGEHFELGMDVRGLTLDDEVKNALPPTIGGLLKDLRLSGGMSFRLDLALPQKGGHKFTLDLMISKGTLDLEPKFEDLEGRVALEGHLDEKLGVRGPLTFSSARVMGKRMTDLSATLTVLESSVLLQNLKATAYGGIVAGRNFAIDLKTKEYSGELFTIDRLDIGEFGRDTSGFSGKQLAGKVSLEVRGLKGVSGNSALVGGEGRLTIREAQLWDVPVLLSLTKLNLPDLFRERHAFDAGWIVFQMRHAKFAIEDMAFTSKTASLVGRGRLNFDGGLSLHLKAKAGPLFGIPVLGDVFNVFWDFLTGPITNIHVTGTFDDPKVSVGP
jgi:hypothetical protein